MSDNDYALTLRLFDSGEARDKLRQATRIILDLEAAYGAASERAADAEAVYRARLAQEFQVLRNDGEAVEGARIRAHGATAELKREAMAASGALKLAGEKLDDARDSRRSLWRLIEWASRKDAPAGPRQTSLQDERVPNATWP